MLGQFTEGDRFELGADGEVVVRGAFRGVDGQVVYECEYLGVVGCPTSPVAEGVLAAVGECDG